MYNEVNSFAVLGAGNGGQAMAAYLALQGYRVNLYNRSEDRIEPVKKAGGIDLKGVYTGFGRLNRVTTDPAEALEGVEVIIIITPAVAHRELAGQIYPYLKDGHIIILSPGRTGGALEFNSVLRKKNCSADVIIAETQTFMYASRVTGPARARIFGEKNRVALAAFPGVKTGVVIDKIRPVFPQYFPVENVLKTGLDNIGAIFHPAPTILNMGWIESTGGAFNYYQDGITPALTRILEELDRERMAVAEHLDIKACSACDWLRISYGSAGENLYELLQNTGLYSGITAPHDLNTRYLFEDVPMSLVPISSLGKIVGVKTPVIDMIIDMADIIHRTNYRREGRTVESLGLAGLSLKEIKNMVNYGYTDKKLTNRKYILDKVNKMIFNNSESYLKEGGLES